MRQESIDRVVIHEGEVKRRGRHVMYKDSKGIWTLGYGRNIQERGLSDEEADYLLRHDLEDAAKDLLRNHPWVLSLNLARHEVLVEMVFNMGIDRFNTFVNMLAAAKAHDFETAAAEMLDSKWHREDVYGRAETLAMIMLNGK
jgi:lysozyme